MENESKTQPEKNVITNFTDFIYLINHHLVVFLRLLLVAANIVIVMCRFFSLYVFAYFSLWWFLLLPAKNQSRPYDIRTIVQVILNTLHTTNLFTQRPNKMSSKLHFAHSTAKLSIPYGCFAGIVPAFVFHSTSFTSLFTIFLNTLFFIFTSILSSDWSAYPASHWNEVIIYMMYTTSAKFYNKST